MRFPMWCIKKKIGIVLISDQEIMKMKKMFFCKSDEQILICKIEFLAAGTLTDVAKFIFRKDLKITIQNRIILMTVPILPAFFSMTYPV
jgi:hypothetical protein